MSQKPTSEKLIKQQRMQGVRQGFPVLGPQTVHFDLANACNVRCTTCWHHSELLLPQHVPTASWKKQQLPFESFKRIFDELMDMGGLQYIILSGMGDPSLHPDLVEMVLYAHKHSIHVTIITNLLAVRLADLFTDRQSFDASLLDLLVSVCGVTPDVWNAFHAMHSGFDKLLSQLDYLKSFGFKPKHVQVINSQNFHQLDQMVRFANTYPAKRVNFKFASLANGTQACALTSDQKYRLIHELIPRAHAIAQLSNVSTDLKEFRTQIDLTTHRTAPIEKVGCYMGTVYCRITVELELLYCCNTDVSVGFITQENSFRDLWNGKRYEDLRKQLSSNTFFPSCEQCGKYKQNVKWAQRLGRLHKDLETLSGDSS